MMHKLHRCLDDDQGSSYDGLRPRDKRRTAGTWTSAWPRIHKTERSPPWRNIRQRAAHAAGACPKPHNAPQRTGTGTGIDLRRCWGASTWRLPRPRTRPRPPVKRAAAAAAHPRSRSGRRSSQGPGEPIRRIDHMDNGCGSGVRASCGRVGLHALMQAILTPQRALGRGCRPTVAVAIRLYMCVAPAVLASAAHKPQRRPHPTRQPLPAGARTRTADSLWSLALCPPAIAALSNESVFP